MKINQDERDQLFTELEAAEQQVNDTKYKDLEGDYKGQAIDKIVEQFPIGKIDTARALAAILDKVMDWDCDDMGPKGDPKIAISVLDKLMDMNDMKGKGKVITTQQIEASTVETTLADIQEKKKLFKATQTEESDGLEQTAEKEEESKQKEA